MKFFKAHDIEEFSKWAGKEYSKPDPVHQQFMDSSMKPLFQQTKYWAQEVAKQLPEFTVTTGRYLKRGRKVGTAETVPFFQTYTWAMVVTSEYKDLGVYFTVGVDTDSKSLIYKLDCERIPGSFSKKRKLSPTQQEQCRAYLNSHQDLIHQVKVSDLETASWSTLISDTTAFIDLHTVDYMNLIDIVKK